MAESKVPFHITYRKTGTSPPIYIAGSFSDPQWQLQEMDHGIDGDGEHTFKAQLMVEPEKEYQFKLRIGEGDWWILSDNYPIGMISPSAAYIRNPTSHIGCFSHGRLWESEQPVDCATT